MNYWIGEAHEPGLADPSVAEHGDEPYLPRFAGLVELGLERGELAVAADERRLGPVTPRGRINESGLSKGRHSTGGSLPLASIVRSSPNSNAPRAAATARSPTRVRPARPPARAAPRR